MGNTEPNWQIEADRQFARREHRDAAGTSRRQHRRRAGAVVRGTPDHVVLGDVPAKVCVTTPRRTDGNRNRPVSQKTPASTSRRFASRAISPSLHRRVRHRTRKSGDVRGRAIPVKNLTHSPLDVGSIGLVELLPLVVFGLYGGVLADRLNRRRLIISMEQVLMLSTAVCSSTRCCRNPRRGSSTRRPSSLPPHRASNGRVSKP